MIKDTKIKTKESLLDRNTVNSLSHKEMSRKLIAVFIELASLIFLMIFSELYLNSKPSVIVCLKDIGVTAFFMLVLVLVAVLILDKRINYFGIFYILAYIFSFGQSLGFAFGLIKPSTNILCIANGYFTAEQIFKSAMFVLQASVIFALGYTVFYKSVQINKSVIKGNKNKENDGLRTLGWILLVVSFIPTFYLTIKDIIILKDNIYANSQYTVTGIEKIFTLLTGFFDAGIILLLITEKRKYYKITIYIVLGLYCVLQMLGGSRFDVFKYIVLLVLLYFNRSGKFGFKKFIMLVIVVFALAFVFSVISATRQEKFSTIEESLQFIILSFKEENIFSKVLYEAGITQIFNTLVISNCPVNIGYCNGSILYKILLGVVPNLGFWSVHPTGITTEIVFSKLYVDFGLGSSLWMEAYWNFGTIGAYIAVFILGFIFAKLIMMLNGAINKGDNKIQFIIYYLMFYFVISVRSDMTQIGRDFVYYVIIPLVLYWLVTRKKLKTVNNKK